MRQSAQCRALTAKDEMKPTSTPCAVIYAGKSAELMLAIEARSGRFPIQISRLEAPVIGWIANDGQAEQIELEGASAAADYRNICKEIECGELLVAEVADLDNGFSTDEATYHQVGLPTCEAERQT